MAGLRSRAWLVSALVTVACGPGGGSTTSASTTSTSGSSDEGDASTTTPSGSTTTPDGTSDDGASSSSTGGPVSPPECRDYEGQATPAQTATTPRADAEAELLAIEASGEIVAPQPLYDRVVAELAAIRADQPTLVAIVARPSWPPSSVVISLDEEGIAAYDAGTFHAWDCPNELYHATAIEDGFLASLVVRFAGLYDIRQVLEDYLVVEHVEHAEVELTAGDGPDVCVSIDGDLHTYVFDDAGGDCPAGCTEHLYTGFTVDLAGIITALGSFDPDDPVPPPAWFEDAESCTTWL
jgi:hypothetical protein